MGAFFIGAHGQASPREAQRPTLTATRKRGNWQARVLDALRPGHWVDREPLDRIAGSSNSPDVVWKLRHKFGQDAIDMELIDGTDQDGLPCRTGRYRLTEQGRDRLIQLGMSTGAEGRAA